MNYATAFLGAATALLITLGSVVADEAAAPVEKDAAPAPQAEPQSMPNGSRPTPRN